MKKSRVKRFLIVFFALLLIQFLVGLADIYFNRNNNELSSITDVLMSIFSMPMGLIHRGLPFYINEALPIKAVFWVVNVFLQTTILLGGVSLLRKLRQTLKH